MPHGRVGLWHFQRLSCVSRLPKAIAYLAITSKAAYESPRAAAATHLVLKLAEDALCETAYLADVAGLTYDVRPPVSMHTPHACVPLHG